MGIWPRSRVSAARRKPHMKIKGLRREEDRTTTTRLIRKGTLKVGKINS